MMTVFARAQTSQMSSPNFGSVPSGPATNEVVHLTLSGAINMALRYNLGEIESGENIRAARGEWPNRSLYHAILNTATGDETVIQTILNLKKALDQ